MATGTRTKMCSWIFFLWHFNYTTHNEQIVHSNRVSHVVRYNCIKSYEVNWHLTYDLVPKGAHARHYALQLKIKYCWKLFLFEMLRTCMNEWIYSTDNFSNQAVVDFKIQSSDTEKAPKNDRQKWTSMYRVIFVTLLTNKSQAHGEPISDLYAENIVLYG